MNLHDFLHVCDPNAYVGIWDVDGNPCREHKSKRKFEEQPTEQNYFKIRNIPYGRIADKLEKEVCCINHTSKGFLVRIHTKDRAKKSLEQYDLADKIADAIKRKMN